ncbi:MAG TPA: hypothetical protein VIF15_07785 [Polyangiaceae bacterium]
MRACRRVAAVFAGLALGAGLFACFDLFHSTGDVLTACELDAQAPGCASAGATDFCAWSPSDARQQAQHACAWLGACETPMGRNAFGSCMFQALLAYDCAANPGHPVKGRTHDLWDCLARVKTCGDVDGCVFPKGTQSCEVDGDITTCGTAVSDTANNFDVRIECIGDGVSPPANAHGENCALWGQTCTTSGAVGTCAGGRSPQTECQGVNCTTDGLLHVCVDGGDLGIDCRSNGAGSCSGYPTPGAAQWVACVPEGDGGACTPSEQAQCANGVATSCPAGVPETLDCQALLQQGASCSPGKLSPPFDWTSPCVVTQSPCSADSCSGMRVSGCARGATFTVDCGQVGLGPCRTVTTDQGSAQHAACTPP